MTGNTRYTNGTFFRGALVFKMHLRLAKKWNPLAFGLIRNYMKIREKSRSIRIEGIELYHYFSGKRPAYFSMQFLQRLKGTIIAKGNEYIMTENERGYQLILMNY